MNEPSPLFVIPLPASVPATTNDGVVVFNDVAEADYIVKGKLYNVSLEETSISKDEFIA